MKLREGTEKQIKVLKNLRNKLEMNRSEFARQMGIPLRTVEEWESGNRKMPDYILRYLVYYALGRFVLFKNQDDDYKDMIKEEDLE